MSEGGLPEVQGQASRIPLSLERVGVLNVKMPIAFIDFEGKLVTVVPSFDAFVDLPASLKGIHASRSYEVITEALSVYSGRPFKLEELCLEASKELLRRHEYAGRSEVRARGEAVISRLTPKSRAKTFETCDIYASAISRRRSEIYPGFRVGVAGEKLSEIVRGYDLRIATSRMGRDISGLLGELGAKAKEAGRICVAFGSAREGLYEIAEKQGFRLEESFDYVLNTFPGQGVRTIRVEEAVAYTLAILNLLLG